MRRALRILCVFEDRAFEDVAVPVIERVLQEQEWPAPAVEGPFFTRGCSWDRLERILRDRALEGDLLVVGADAGGKSVAHKRRAMTKRIEGIKQSVDPARVVYALPSPCAEGWIQADLRALKAGVQAVLDLAVTLPEDAGPYPSGEGQAKERLGSLLARAKVPTLLGGLEFGRAVMSRADLKAHPSLEVFVRDLKHWLSEHP